MFYTNLAESGIELSPLTRGDAHRQRHNTTHSEQRLWLYPRRKQMDGRKFLRQHAIIYETIGDDHYFYVPDFFCFSENLAIELDGKIHFYTKDRDKHRDEILNGEKE